MNEFLQKKKIKMLNSQFIFLCCMSGGFWMTVSNVCIDFRGGGKKLLVSAARTGQVPVTGEWITSKLAYCRRGLQLQEANAQHLVPTACVNSSVGAAQCALVSVRVTVREPVYVEPLLV